MTENLYNNEYVVDKTAMDSTHGEIMKMDSLVVSSDIIRAMKMIYNIGAGWGEEYSETVDEFFHPQSLTLSVRNALGMKIE